jgi:hypothetical protein
LCGSKRYLCAITRCRGILRQADKEKLLHQLYLFYVNHRPEDAALLTEQQDLSESIPHFIFIPSMTEMERSKQNWSGERGFINRASKSFPRPKWADLLHRGPSRDGGGDTTGVDKG